MATQFSMLQIINAALSEQGEYTVNGEDASNEWLVLSRNWPLIVEAELEDGAYNFTRRQIQLETRTNGKYGYDDAYAVPLDVLHVRRLWTEDEGGVRSFPDWTQDGSNVYVNDPNGCFVEVVEVPGVDLWSANFARGIQLRLEAVILRSLKSEPNQAADMDARAEMHFDRARVKSSKSRSATEPYREGRLHSARFRRG